MVLYVFLCEHQVYQQVLVLIFAGLVFMDLVRLTWKNQCLLSPEASFHVSETQFFRHQNSYKRRQNSAFQIHSFDSEKQYILSMHGDRHNRIERGAQKSRES